MYYHPLFAHSFNRSCKTYDKAYYNEVFNFIANGSLYTFTP
jgi:hypothetical protein